jgi:hypothetical protein
MATITAEDYAAQLLRPHLDRMERPPLQDIADECALTVREVEAIMERMLSGRRDTRPAPSRTVPTTVAAPQPPAWLAALDHPTARIRKAAEKAQAGVQAVERLLAEDAGKAALRAREAKLRAELAKVRAELGHPTGTASPRPKVACPDCGDLVGNLGVHLARSKKHR